ncbi:transposase family protein [Pseudoalteromonas fenneropenaei]|uniref:Transposase family protein n=1 Tax=Pseudoalteromonas fenneropenaei TaxID=1737459 RepID=A0ABV7CJZ2_9GAMM
MCISEQLKTIPDHRHNMNKKHDLIDVIFLTFSAILSGVSGWESI